MKKKNLLKNLFSVAIALSMIITNTSCTKKNDESDNLKLVWYCTSSGKDPDHDKVLNVFNQKLKEKYGMELDFYPITGGEYASKMQVLNASREEYDLCYVNGLTSYYDNIKNGAYYDITDLLETHAPETYKSLSEDVWKAASYKDRIYAVPNWQIMARSDCLIISDEWLQKTNVSIENINNMEDLEGYLAKVNDINPNANKVKLNNFLLRYYGFADVYSETAPGVIRISEFDKGAVPKIINQYETEEFKEFVNFSYDMVQKGYLYDIYSPEISSASARGEEPFSFQPTYKPGIAGELGANYGYPLEAKQFSNAVLTPTNVMATATAVSATSKNPEKALEFIEIMNTDKELYNLLCWGIEGEHYTKISENVIEPIDMNKYGYYNWAIGSVKNSYVLSSQENDVWEKTEELNKSALVTPLMGMAIDASVIASEIADCETVINKRVPMLVSGLVEPTKGIQELIDELKIAGSDRIIAEIQKQVDEWWKTK